MADDKINESIMALETKEDEIQKQVEVYHRKLMAPLWKERREIVKQIPNFWSNAIGNSPMFNTDLNEVDGEALEHLIDFDVEFGDDSRPEYRKVTAVFKNNTVFKNETLTKEFTVDDDESKVISKSTIEYHDGKASNGDSKSEEDVDDYVVRFLQWFEDDSITTGVVLTEEIFPAALDYYNGVDSDDEDAEDIELGSDSEDDA